MFGRILLNISASPFYLHKRELRRNMLASIATNYKVPVAMVNQIGGNDSLVFDGSSFAMGPDGKVIAQAKSFEEDLVTFDSESLAGDIHLQDEHVVASAHSALVLGTRDYVRKCGFERAVLGLSGGIDSALTAAIAVDALGKENVIGVGMPSGYSSKGSIDDAAEQSGSGPERRHRFGADRRDRRRRTGQRERDRRRHAEWVLVERQHRRRSRAERFWA